ncbi:helix-turn-helix domain-containing protein [Chryseobacterium wangxinyae]|uniref:helix-turn-helix domain-containing protein n=1 Tax=Chryseobacterium sp. CY350 TaxID=2997336 RepID=UPI002271CF8A|nr:helix-turn-helix domain-containing protein [Chryseobacterium sp. CY350]MCY0976336.1 helix-turn-helix domain-containing protein [Chryseobacterium sp. CY350]WBZ94066.1 helix-turn-helix domain-containing protein [Chryseobacterium sp. CY350]
MKQFSIPDSLKTKSFELLEKSYRKILPLNKTKAAIYANSILLKGKVENSDVRIADGYLMLYQLSSDKSALLYLDSMRLVSRKMNNSQYLANSYKYKGNYYYIKGEYPNALTNYLIARDYSKGDSETFHILNFNIGLLKLELKEYQSATQLFLGYKQYLEKNNAEKSFDYLSSIYALAYSYSFTNELDLSDQYIELGLKKNQVIKDDESKANLLMVLGINDYKRKNYKEALKSLKSASKLMRDNYYYPQNLAISEYYIGRILYNMNNVDFLSTFEKVDSIIIKTKNVTNELRNTYPLLIEYYKKTGNKEKQLYYIEHLLSVDSILNRNNSFLSTEINKKYDTPILLEEKENLIADLNSKNYTLFWLLGIGGVLLVSLSVLQVKNRKKIKLYQSKADLLIQSSIPIENIDPIDIVAIDEVRDDTKKERSKNTLSDDKLKQLNIMLKEFENGKRFLDKTINLEVLSKELNTNRAYLSKSVNNLKGLNFPQYLNQLRIKYIIEELKKNKSLQKLTIVALADEAGYNNVESFTNAFKKITGTLPSYFIKALQENIN